MSRFVAEFSPALWPAVTGVNEAKQHVQKQVAKAAFGRTWREVQMALVVFLRGVNVGGHRTFRPADLAKQLAELDVVNIGAAGTFVVRQPITQARLRSELARRLPFETTIMLCRGRDVLELLAQDPFKDQPVRPDIVRFVSILSSSPGTTPEIPLSFPANGKWLVKILGMQHRFVFGLYRRQMKAIRYLGEIDRLFGSVATTRNWNTINAIGKVLGNR